MEDTELRIKFGGWNESQDVIHLFKDDGNVVIHNTSHLNILVKPLKGCDINLGSCDTKKLKMYTLVASKIEHLGCAIELSYSLTPESTFMGSIHILPTFVKSIAKLGVSWNSTVESIFPVSTLLYCLNLLCVVFQTS